MFSYRVLSSLLCVQEGKTAYVLILMAVYWVSEALPIAVTSLLPIFLFPMMDIISAKDIAKSYMKVSFTALKAPNFSG